MIPLSKPWFDRSEEEAILKVMRSGELAGNGKECSALEQELKNIFHTNYVLVVSSGSHALEMAMELLNVRGGEVILPSFTFPSVANAIIRAGARPVFCEIREPDLNIDLNHAESLITSCTKAIVVTHYGGHPVSFEGIPIPVVEDAAHALGSMLDSHYCGTLGSFGCLSFHQTKNVASGEGGALICQSHSANLSALIFREKGTNRDLFKAGLVDFYTWVGIGSSYVLPELSAAIVRVQLAKLDEITSRRRAVATCYDEKLVELEKRGDIRIVRPREGQSSYHTYAILVDPSRRDAIISKIRSSDIEAAFHFIPLHSSPYGKKIVGTLKLSRTEHLANSIIRLPIYPGLSHDDLEKVAKAVKFAFSLS